MISVWSVHEPCIPHDGHHRGSLAPGRGPPWPMAPAPESAPESVAVKFDIKAKMENAQNGQNANIEATKEEPRESKIQNQSTGTGIAAHYLHDRLCFPAPAPTHIFWILNSNFCRTLPEKPVRLYVNREDHHLGHLEAEFLAVQAKFHSECPHTLLCVFYSKSGLLVSAGVQLWPRPLLAQWHDEHHIEIWIYLGGLVTHHSSLITSYHNVWLATWTLVFAITCAEVGLLFKICELLTSHGVDICSCTSNYAIVFFLKTK